MCSQFGTNIKIKIYGSSHGPLVGVTIDGIPQGKRVDMDRLQAFLDRRGPGKNQWSTARKEADKVEVLSGLKDGITDGNTFEAIIRNTDVRTGDYDEIRKIPRPGHADYTAYEKYKGKEDMSGGGQFSGRMTAPLCIAGGIFKQLLEEENIYIGAYISSVGKCQDDTKAEETLEKLKAVAGKDFPVIDDAKAQEMKEIIERAKADGDSVGGTIRCVTTGLPVGIGGPLFDGLETTISQAIFAIPAVKGIEFGAGFEAASMKGSENNDPFYLDKDGNITMGNNHGGILGGISSGMALTFRVAIKPTPSIAKEQPSVDLEKMEETTLKITGRHDPCIVPRGVPCVEAACAIAIYDRMLDKE